MKQLQHAKPMKASANWIGQAKAGNFESSGEKTLQFINFAHAVKRWFTEFVTVHGYSNLKFRIGHFEFSGNFTDDTGQAWHFFSGDVRHNYLNSMVLRTVKSYTDYTGGHNNTISYDNRERFAENMVQIIYRAHPDL